MTDVCYKIGIGKSRYTISPGNTLAWLSGYIIRFYSHLNTELGSIVNYMLGLELKHDFLTTYARTMFLRKVVFGGGMGALYPDYHLHSEVSTFHPSLSHAFELGLASPKRAIHLMSGTKCTRGPVATLRLRNPMK